MSVRNGIHFLSGSRKHIENNTSSYDDIVIVDDGSDDGSSSFLAEWSKSDDRVTVINSGGVGLIDSLNLGLTACSNDWVARFDVDDDYVPDRLNRQIACITDGDVAIFSDYEFVGEDGEHLGVLPTAIVPDAVAISLVSAQRTPHPSVIFNRNAVRDAGNYRVGDFLVEDLSLWLRLNKIGNIKSIPEPLLKYRLHINATSMKNRDAMTRATSKILKEISIPSYQIQKVLAELPQIFDTYDLFDFPIERKLLLLRELSKLGISKTTLISRLFKAGFSPFESSEFMKSAFMLNKDVVARKKYRTKNSE
jgi:glycosyltransferase involved in cell wall biosynthesis